MIKMQSAHAGGSCLKDFPFLKVFTPFLSDFLRTHWDVESLPASQASNVKEPEKGAVRVLNFKLLPDCVNFISGVFLPHFHVLLVLM